MFDENEDAARGTYQFYRNGKVYYTAVSMTETEAADLTETMHRIRWDSETEYHCERVA